MSDFMSDREILELAAKAMGVEGTYGTLFTTGGREMQVINWPCPGMGEAMKRFMKFYGENMGSSPSVAARRAITRVAAEYAKTLDKPE